MRSKENNIGSTLAALLAFGLIAFAIFATLTAPGKPSFHAEKRAHIAASKYLTIYGPSSPLPLAVYSNVRDINIEEGIDPESTNSDIRTLAITTFHTDKGATVVARGTSRPLISSYPPITEQTLRTVENQERVAREHRKAHALAREVAQLIKEHQN